MGRISYCFSTSRSMIFTLVFYILASQLSICVTAMRSKQIIEVLLLKNMIRRCQGMAGAQKALLFKRWRYSEPAEEKLGIPSDVPVGHNPVYVGSERRRFIIPTTYLNHPLFRELLCKAEEEFGFDHQMGLLIPCEEVTFEYLTSIMAGQDSQQGSSLNVI